MKVVVFSFLLLLTFYGYSQKVSAESDNRFSLALYKEIVSQSTTEDVLISPFSVLNAMGMVYSGSAGETKNQFDLLLNPKNDLGEFSQHVQSVNQSVLQDDALGTLNLANAMWMDQHYLFSQNYVDDLLKQYNAKAQQVSFETPKKVKKTTKIINSWVSSETDKNIDEILKKEDILTNTKLILTNAFHFKGVWQSEFDESNTIKKDFENLNGSTSSVDFMHQKGKYHYARVKGAEVIALPYKGSHFSMYIVLPDNEHAFLDYEQGFSEKDLEYFLQNSNEMPVSLALPKFTVSFNAKLKSSLINLGITDAFSSDADFSLITGEKDLMVDEMYHSTSIKVEESGVEASASTAVVMVRKSALLPIEMHVNRSFIYFIRDNESGMLLFLGRKVSFN